VVGILESGERIDLTGEAEVDTTGAPVERGDDGYFTPTGAGSGALTVEAAGLTATVPVTVQATGTTNSAQLGRCGQGAHGRRRHDRPWLL